MIRTSELTDTSQNLNALERGRNALLGTALIAAILSHSDGHYLGWLAILPLIAVYPCLSAITGYSPLRGAASRVSREIRLRHRPTGYGYGDAFAQ